MKRFIIIILMILLTVMLVPMQTYAYSESQLDVPITELNNHTLREVFESTIPALENLVTNGDFSDFTNWVLRANSSQSITSGEITVTATNDSTSVGIEQTSSYGNSSNVFYIKTRIKSNSLNVINIGSAQGQITLSQINTYETKNITVVYPAQLSFRVYQSLLSGQSFTVDYVMLFNLTTSHGVTAKSGAAYDNAVAEIEWILSKNDGYIQSVGNPFEIVDLTVSQMDYWYSVYLFNKDHEVYVTNEGLGSDLMNVLKGFINTLISLFDYIMYTKVMILGIEFSFLGLIGSGLILLILAFQFIWLVI